MPARVLFLHVLFWVAFLGFVVGAGMWWLSLSIESPAAHGAGHALDLSPWLGAAIALGSLALGAVVADNLTPPALRSRRRGH